MPPHLRAEESEGEGEGFEDERAMSPDEERRLHRQIQDEIGGPVQSIEDLHEQQAKAKEGDAHAQARLGVSHLYGVDGLLPPQPDTGLELLYAAGLQAYGPAFTAIGRYWALEGYPRRAYPWFEKAAGLGDPSAQWELGHRLEEGVGVRTQQRHALQHYEAASRAGDPRAAHNMAMAYLHGEGVARDSIRARQLLQQAADGHVGEAHYQLSLLYEKEGQQARAEEALLQAARVDTPIAQYNLGMLFLQGRLEPANRKVSGAQEATKWIVRAAKLGLGQAQLRAGFHSLYGVGTALDEKAATQWFLEAAQQGLPGAFFLAAHRLTTGQGTEKGAPDLDGARQLMTQLAKTGHLLAATLTSPRVQDDVAQFQTKLAAYAQQALLTLAREAPVVAPPEPLAALLAQATSSRSEGEDGASSTQTTPSSGEKETPVSSNLLQGERSTLTSKDTSTLKSKGLVNNKKNKSTGKAKGRTSPSREPVPRFSFLPPKA